MLLIARDMAADASDVLRPEEAELALVDEPASSSFANNVLS